MAALPIWKDYSVTIPLTAAWYRIRTDSSIGEIIHTGSAVAAPGAANIQVRINAICAPYIAQALPDLSQDFNPLKTLSRKFYIQYTPPGGNVWGTIPDPVEFFADWSHDYGYTPDKALADPVNGMLDPRQRLIFSTLDTGSILAAVITDDAGTSVTKTFGTPPMGGNAVLDIAAYPGAVQVRIGGRTYEVAPSPCAEYALHYVNAYGGWDSLLVEGRTTHTDGYVRHTQRIGVPNDTPDARQRADYAIDVERRFIFRTGWLTDEQSARMHHLTGSPQVYCEELGTNHFTPLVLTDAEYTRKTYFGENARLVRYDISATLAQNITRE